MKLHSINPAGGKSPGSDIAAQLQVRRGSYLRLKPRSLHRNFREIVFAGRFNPFGRANAFLMQLSSALEVGPPRLREFGSQLRLTLIGLHDLSKAVLRRRQVVERAFGRASVLSLQ